VATAPPHPATLDVDPGEYGSPARSEWMDVDWRRHVRWVRVDGRRVNVCEMGSGPPLVFVHGHSGRWQNWLEQIPHFARTHRVVAMDLPGFGESQMPSEHVSIEGYGRFLGRLLDELEIDEAPLVGNSMGGFVAAEACLQAPDRTSALVLVSAAGLSTRYLGLSAELMRRRSVVGLARAVNAYAKIPEARIETLVRRPRLRWAVLNLVAKHPERLSAPMAAELIKGSGKAASAFAMRAIMEYDFRDRLDDVDVPTLVVWGDSDRVVPVDGAEEYARLIRGARKAILPDTGHVPMVERPQAFNRLLEEFLDSLSR
jgi:pimeloyl-ACP methyl ester carboxylesterase